jgi:hypothetical protein
MIAGKSILDTLSSKPKNNEIVGDSSMKKILLTTKSGALPDFLNFEAAKNTSIVSMIKAKVKTHLS